MGVLGLVVSKARLSVLPFWLYKKKGAVVSSFFPKVLWRGDTLAHTHPLHHPLTCTTVHQRKTIDYMCAKISLRCRFSNYSPFFSASPDAQVLSFRKI